MIIIHTQWDTLPPPLGWLLCQGIHFKQGAERQRKLDVRVNFQPSVFDCKQDTALFYLIYFVLLIKLQFSSGLPFFYMDI